MSNNRILAVALALLLLATACGSDDQPVAAAEPASDEATTGDEQAMGAQGDCAAAVPEDAGFPVTIESAAGSMTLETQPSRIVSLSPTATEMLFAIGAGDQVVAADAFSNYPPEAPVTDLSGFDPNVEAVAAFEPDLVVISFDANDLTASLTSLGIPVLVSSAPADIESGYGVIAELGIAAGRIDETAAVVATMCQEIAAAFAAAPDASFRIYHEIDDTYYSASSFGFIGAVYAQMGMTNIADAADSTGSGFPQLTEEAIVAADPELIVITNQVSYTPADVAKRPAWTEVSAVKTGNVVVVDADIASRWGPRLPQFITAIAQALAGAAAPA